MNDFANTTMPRKEQVGVNLLCLTLEVQRVIEQEGVTPDFKIAKCEPQSIVHTDFLRSGAAVATSSRAEPEEDQSELSSSLNERLEKFHQRTQSAVQEAVEKESVSRDFKVAKCEPLTIVNLDFLRSGREFTPSPLHSDEDTPRKRSCSMHERLEQFYETTQAAVQGAVENDGLSADFKHAKCEARTIVNVDFLRSGGEFSPRTAARMAHDPLPGAAPVSAAKLDAFYAQTQAAVARAVIGGHSPKAR